MSESPDPSQRIAPETVRRVDWLSVAPWVLLARAPAACLWTPLLVGATGAVLFGWPAIDQDPSRLDLDRLVGRASSLLFPSFRASVGSPWTLVGLFIWPLIGVLIPRSAAASMAGGRRERFRDTVRMVPKRCLRVAVAVGILLAPVAVLAVLLRLFFLSMGLPVVGLAAGAALPLALWLLAIPAAAMMAIAVLGCPLAVAAVCLDDADAFDAASRAVAYTTQRLGRLAFYLVVAAAIGVAAGGLIEALLAGGLAFGEQCGSGLPRLRNTGVPLDLAFRVAIRGVRGFYPAYFFTASTAIYLLLRHDIDGQPLDETAGAAQPSAKA